MKLKKGLSILLSLAMLITVLPITAFAVDGLVGTDKAKVSLVYMEYKAGFTLDSQGRNEENPIVEEKAVPAGIESKAEHEFMLGIKLSEFTNLTAAPSGMNIFGLGIKYDPTYIEIVDDVAGSNFMRDNQRRMGGGWEDKADPTPNDPILYDGSGYAFTSSAMDKEKDTPDGKKAVTIVLADNVNFNYKGTQPAYAAIIKMKLKDPAAAKASGQQLFSIVSGEDTNMSFGESGAAGSYIYGTGDSRMENIVDFEFPELFPTPETDASAVYKSGTFNNLSSLVAGDTLSKASIIFTVTTNKGNASDKSATGLFYGAAGKTSKDGLTEITAGVTKAMSGQHLYAVYEKDAAFGIKDLGEMTVKAAKTVASIAVEGTVANKTYGDKIATTGLTVKATYTDTTDWPTETITSGITWQVVPPTGSAANLDTNKAYHAGDGYKLKATYSNESAETAAFNIAKKALSVPASVGTATAVTVGATGDDLKVKGTYTFKTADGLVGSDVVTADWNGAYANANTAGAVEVDVTLAATLAGAAKDNYTFAGGASKANGSISADPLKTITVTAPTGTFTTDTGIDLTTLKAKGVKNSGAVDFDAANFEAIITAGCEVFVDGVKTETAQVAVTTEGAHTIKVTKSGIEGTATVTVGAGATVAPVEKPVVGEITNASAKVTNAPTDANTVKYAIVEVTDEANIVAPAADAYTAGKVAFDELKKDTKYVIFAIALGNGTDVVDSEPVHSDIFKTFKNKITILDKNEDEMSVGYADDIAELTEDELHKIVEEPSRLDGYYTEAAFEKEVEFPIALTDDLTLYAKIKKSSSGGGGGGGWNISTTKPALSLNQKTLSGHVGETATLRATLTDSTEKITWESDNEAVATVDENGVVTFVAVGTANITAIAGSLKDTAEVKVVEDDVEVPAEESLINEKYTGPYVYGYEDGTFGAAREITRAEVVAMVSRLLKNPIDENKNYDTNFTDVAADAWYKNYIGFLAQYNIVEGYGDGTFAPANKITRAEMTAILARAAKFQLTGSATTFSDVDNSFWAKAYIATMAEKGLVNGYPDGTFAPNKNITRAETVTILNRMLDDSTVSGSIIPADVDSSYWAYNDIVKAMNDRVLD